MIINAYTIYDAKSLTYSPPFYAAAHGQACRNVMDACSDPNTSLARHPADYQLFCIGRFDDQRGQLLPLDVREHVSDVVALVPQRPAPLFDPDQQQPGTSANGRA